MAIPGFMGVAGGDINPARFVNLSAAANKTVLEADAGERTFGISQDAAHDPPIPSASTLAAASGDQIQVFIDGQFCLLEIGSGGCTAGDILKSDADGKGVVASSNNDWVGAEALETCSASELCLVKVTGYYYGA